MTKNKPITSVPRLSLYQVVKAWLQDHPNRAIGPTEMALELSSKISKERPDKKKPSRQNIGLILKKLVDEGFAINDDRGAYQYKQIKDDFQKIIASIEARGRVTRQEFNQIVAQNLVAGRSPDQIVDELFINGYVKTLTKDGTEYVENHLGRSSVLNLCPVCGGPLEGDVVAIDSNQIVQFSEDDYSGALTSAIFHKSCAIKEIAAGSYLEKPFCAHCLLPLGTTDLLDLSLGEVPSWVQIIEARLYKLEHGAHTLTVNNFIGRGLSEQDAKAIIIAVNVPIPPADSPTLRSFEYYLESLERLAQSYREKKEVPEIGLFNNPIIFPSAESLKKRAQELFLACVEETRRVSEARRKASRPILEQYFPASTNPIAWVVDSHTHEWDFAQPQNVAQLSSQTAYDFVMISGRKYHPGCALKIKAPEANKNEQ